MFNVANCRQEEEEEAKPNVHPFTNCKQKEEEEAKPNIHFFANCMQKQEEGKPKVHVFC